MIIGHDRPLDRRIDRFTKNHRPCTRIIDNHFDIADLHNIIGFSFLWINSGLYLFFLLLDTVNLSRRMSFARPLMRPVRPVQAVASDLIGWISIGHALVVQPCRTQALCDPHPCGEMVGIASDNNTSKFLHAPM